VVLRLSGHGSLWAAIAADMGVSVVATRMRSDCSRPAANRMAPLFSIADRAWRHRASILTVIASLLLALVLLYLSQPLVHYHLP
jgi:hypothetical protein